MRKVSSTVVGVLVGVLVLAVACGSGGETGVGLSGDTPDPEVTEATTTVASVTTTTLPLTVQGDIPDVSDLAISVGLPTAADPVTGRIDVSAFNAALLGDLSDHGAGGLPTLAAAPGSFDGLEGEALAEAEAVAEAAAPLRLAALALGLEPGQPGVQLLLGPAGGPEGTRVVVIRSVGEDSVRAERYELVVEIQNRESFVPPAEPEAPVDGAVETTTTTLVEQTGPIDRIPVLVSVVRTTQCEPEEGHQDFTTGDCGPIVPEATTTTVAPTTAPTTTSTTP